MVKLFERRQKIWLDYQNYPCSDNFDLFKAVNKRFDCLLDRYKKYIENKILEGPNKSSLHRLLHSILKRPERIPALKDVPNDQHGFRTGRSTETLMLSALNDWTQALEHKTDVDVIYFDFMKAFDKVPFERLVAKLIELGVHPRVTNWIKNFITGRSFQVRINESFSESFPVTSGVP